MSLKLVDFSVRLAQQPLFQTLNVQLAAQEVLAVVGSSGAGKSSLLAAIAGTLDPHFSISGDIYLAGNNLYRVPIEQRRVGILFQDDLLFPHLNVYQNLVFGLSKKLSKKEKMTRIDSALAAAELAGYGKRDPATLSGGQRARIALLRTLLAEPALILLDEPFARLDQSLRIQFRDWVFQQIRYLQIPAVLVTHDHSDIPTGAQVIKLVSPND